MTDTAPATGAETRAPSVAVAHTSDDFDDVADTSTTADQGNPDDGNDDADDSLGDAGKQALNRMKNERSQARRELTQARARIAELERAGQSESERALADAETRGRQAALQEVGTRLARSQFDVLAARRNADFDTESVVEWIDMGKFMDETGEIDNGALQAAVDRLVPEVPKGPPSQDGGPRTTALTTDMNSIIRSQARGNRSA